MIERSELLLYVEGGDDAHFIHHFYKKLRGHEIVVVGEKRSIIDCKSVERLLDKLEGVAGLSEPSAVGFVLDANGAPSARWDEIRKRLNGGAPGGGVLPATPDNLGTIIRLRNRRLGIWLMPFPGTPGDMELFLTEIRVKSKPQADLWNHASESLGVIPQPQLFADKDKHKALLRTWLAWQKEPGASYGLAASQSAFDLEHPWAVSFGSWLDRLIGHAPPLPEMATPAVL